LRLLGSGLRRGLGLRGALTGAATFLFLGSLLRASGSRLRLHLGARPTAAASVLASVRTRHRRLGRRRRLLGTYGKRQSQERGHGRDANQFQHDELLCSVLRGRSALLQTLSFTRRHGETEGFRLPPRLRASE